MVFSVTVTVCDMVLEFPQASVALQVRKIVNTIGQIPGVCTSLIIRTGTSPEHKSTAVKFKTGDRSEQSAKRFAGGFRITGGVLSVTEMVRLQVDKLPQLSVAVHVRVTLYSCVQMPLWVVRSVKVIAGLTALHKSVAVAIPKLGVAGHSMLAMTVGQVITGPVKSVTAMVRLQVAEFPQLSEAVQVRVTLYDCTQMPPGVVRSVKLMVAVPLHKSLAEAAGKTGVAGHTMVATTVGQIMTGAVLSVTKIVRLHIAEFPQLSVAVQVRVILYAWAQMPPGVVTSLKLMIGAPSHKSVAVAMPNEPGNIGHSIGVTTVGQVMTGAVWSPTEMVRLQVAEFPQSSVATQVRVTL
jgi:hypothetical protein